MTNMDFRHDIRYTFYRETYKNSKKWEKGSLSDKVVIIYCEQGIGDTIQILRYCKYLKCKDLYLHCDKSLHRLIPYKTIDKESSDLPEHDCHIMSLDLPFLDIPIVFPYISVSEREDLSDFTNKVGICWEGNTNCCPLRLFKDFENFTFFKLQRNISVESVKDAEDFCLYGTEILDFYDLAKLINSLDFVISVDTAVLHLAGAMNKESYALLKNDGDYRWKVRVWYPRMDLVFGDSWEEIILKLKEKIYVRTVSSITSSASSSQGS